MYNYIENNINQVRNLIPQRSLVQIQFQQPKKAEALTDIGFFLVVYADLVKAIIPPVFLE
ncbi:MAG: hypothetical protein DKM50_09425 [Candidatus Margulisiibacteriota bacterium]|nr:MAG: hypothetical protein A2X43_11595 [Candidatus Margulisbacteria bacterium GWD2_39_127]OGI02345.1 MAG: hypothetical protein A2X42_09330 [Candidatus Margulisbacteria bacterium GWF2_38_17]PZM78989.1 MAG: hypothetical protein DKM50_09425 [Candidatus Margulisiibacteriota bacterium]HAR62577.1 hypothetical protein [Candidatus Margulisiibacteriota bacterium]HCY36136.1 hypothetical protein [Candidatus Margulisiibacteriota bacterium]